MKSLLICPMEKITAYEFGTTWEWVNNNMLFIFKWTVALMISTGWCVIPDKIEKPCVLTKETFFNKSIRSKRHCILLSTIYCENTYHVWFYKVKNIQLKKLLHCLYGERMVNMQVVVTWTAGWVITGQNVQKLSQTSEIEELSHYVSMTIWKGIRHRCNLCFTLLFSTHHPLLAIRSDCSTLPEKLKALI